MRKLIKLSIISFSLGIAFNGCSYKEVEVRKQTDELLNCQKLTTQIADLMDINKDINSKTGVETSALTSWILWPPIGAYNQYKAYNSRDKIDKRLKYLLMLKYQHKCRITNSERYYMKHKGRWSDIMN